jgi:rare lipoprotein A
MKNSIKFGLAVCAAMYIQADVAAAAQCGGASWYALRSRTASGEMMNPSAMTAAHKTMRFGTKVRVTHAKTGKSVIVRINDRGPFIKGRVIDLSKGAAKKIGLIGAGHGKVCFSKV